MKRQDRSVNREEFEALLRGDAPASWKKRWKRVWGGDPEKPLSPQEVIECELSLRAWEDHHVEIPEDFDPSNPGQVRRVYTLEELKELLKKKKEEEEGEE
jgi:hypothetical protein